ncbi:efflux RND transporter periplasmic adaptor subunit [Belliella sp. DSM 111904]|uniref:Efflux RND transporter periplasmic adaptor subunit n=1 Tax=Belliella filtrata TaxID=2923435 RepID=A0ABS9V311_9BACT|nr:efflux RND transporter periplasmic adaptor subunit [Belliella filtrata]MCH7410801.1 efflux RND transporter periplasmic adaptor subunit [Belliella filtrata]
MKNRKLYISFGIALIVLIFLWRFLSSSVGETFDIMADVKHGSFKVEITSSGELEALNSVEVLGPVEARRFRVNNITIESMVDEGTVVRQGDFIAELDKSELFGRIEDKRLDLEQSKAQYEQIQLDTSLVLRQERDNITNLEYGVQERQLVLEQSQYEPPAIIKQNEYNLEKAERDLEQAKDRYRVKRLQERARMVEVAARVRENENELVQMREVLEKFTVTAPQNGMVIYQAMRGGKVKAGSQVSAWNPVVATLPDLSRMRSVTYINEVDIRKIKAGQEVEIGLDAFPDKKLTGKVTRVANIGQQRPNSDAKVFEVVIEVNESDNTLRPAMTTSNNIVVDRLEDVSYVPLEAINVQNDSINYVFLKNGTKQEVLLGTSNMNDIVIEAGIKTGDRVYLSTPSWAKDSPVKLLPELEGKRRQIAEPDVLEEESGNERPNRPRGERRRERP